MSDLKSLTERIISLNEDYYQEDRTFMLALITLLIEKAEENERRNNNVSS